MFQKFINIGMNALRRKNLSVMAGKLVSRLKEKPTSKKNQAARRWCAQQAQAGDEFLKSLDSELWYETQAACATLEKEARRKLEQINLDLGGGGNYPMLYFFTRYLKAKTIVETGVAAGWSSQAFLSALEKNGTGGRLYSSDFPYFRYKNPEKLVGCVVDEKFKANWSLFIDGDRNNLPIIAAQCDLVDFFHYDSDKSAEGREFAMSIIEPLLTAEALVIFDDIQDNFHFRDAMQRRSWPFKVFEFQGKYVGLTGPAIRGFHAHAHAA